MAKGEDTRHHPARQVGRENSPWSPWSQGTDYTGAYQGSTTSKYEGAYPHTIDVWRSHEGRHDAFHASYEHIVGYSGSSRESAVQHSENYAAGPFRTPKRAQIAGEALANRVALGKESPGGRYHTNPSYTTAAEARYDRA